MIVFFDGEEAIQGQWANDNTLIGSKYFVNNYEVIRCANCFKKRKDVHMSDRSVITENITS
jgi:hypothetical protein